MSSGLESVENPIFTIANQPIAISKDVSYMLANVVPATQGGSSPIGSQTTFNITNSAQAPIDFSNSALSITLSFAADSTVAANLAATLSPPWNLFGRLISGISLDLNSKGTPVISSSSNNYYLEWTAHMLTTYDWSALNNHSAVLAPVANETDQYIGMTSAIIAGSSQALRRSRYVGAYTYFIKLICPFRDLFLGMPGHILKNLRRFDLNITWATLSSVLERANPTGVAETGYVNISRVEILTSCPVKTASQMAETTSEKAEGLPDLIAWSRPIASVMPYTANSSIIISAVKNLEKVFIFQPGNLAAFAMMVAQGAGPGYVATNQTTSSSGQFFLIAKAEGVSGEAAYANRIAADFEASKIMQGLDTVSISYGTITYPQQAITVGQPTTGNYASELYAEFLKAVDCFGAKDVSPLPYYLFKKTMPFICLKPTSAEAATLDNSGKDLIINLRGDTVVGKSVAVVVFSHAIFRVNPDSSIAPISN